MEQNPKQVVAERIRAGSSVLVTVSKDPSVDQLASAIGLTLMLNALGKHTTAVFSGSIPSTVEFLRPEDTFDETVDGLRDFIISLDKEKADKLRYKVEDEIVKIFITPYKNKISENDLEFSQGDYNVDLVIALGVTKRDDLDEAITAHGRILHDATIMTINAGPAISSGVGAVDWSDPNASCLSEMLVSISEALQGGVLDAAMSTAFLTGIVSATDRFKNDKTTPKLMTMSAQLMAAGANQQLIANNLQLDAPAKPQEDKSEVSLHDDKKSDNQARKPQDEQKNDQKEQSDQKQDKKQGNDSKPAATTQEGTFDLEKAKKNIKDDTNLEQIEKDLHAKHGKPKQDEENQVEDESIHKLEEELAHDKSSTLDDIEDKLNSARGSVNEAQQPQAPPQQVPQNQTQLPPPMQNQGSNVPPPMPQQNQQRSDSISQVKGRGPIAVDNNTPSLGGTFNATSEEAHNSADQERQRGLNTEVFSHRIEPASADAQANSAPATASNNPPEAGVDDARKAVEEAMKSQPYTPDNHPVQSLGAQDLPGEGLEDMPQANNAPANNNAGNFAPPPMPPVVNQPYPPMQQQTFAPMQQPSPQPPFQNQAQNQGNVPPPMPQQSPIVSQPSPQQQQPPQPPVTPAQQPMYQTPPPQPYPPSQNQQQNNVQNPPNGGPPNMPPGGPPPMPQF